MNTTESTEAPPVAPLILPEGFEWALVEVFGHRRHAGAAIEVERFGSKLLRIDVPSRTYGATGWTWTTHFYGGGSIFSYTPADEATVLRAATPVKPYSAYSALSDERYDEGSQA